MEEITDIMMVTFNRLGLTIKTLENLLESTNLPMSLIIVDNGSTDNTKEFLHSFKEKNNNKFTNITLLFNQENKGIATGRNQALKLSTNTWLATLDNDVLLPQYWLEECIKVLKCNPQYGAIGVNFEKKEYNKVFLNKVSFFDKPNGNLGTACMVFNRKIHKLLGFFDNFPNYAHEDADFGFRIRMAGFKLGYIKMPGVHLGEGSLDQGQYREFKNHWHKLNLDKFNQNCREYFNRKKSLYIPFQDE